MITSSDSFSTFEFDTHFKILPADKISSKKYERNGITLKKVEDGFSYCSKNNTHFLKVDEIRELIRLNVDRNFKPI